VAAHACGGISGEAGQDNRRRHHWAALNPAQLLIVRSIAASAAAGRLPAACRQSADQAQRRHPAAQRGYRPHPGLTKRRTSFGTARRCVAREARYMETIGDADLCAVLERAATAARLPTVVMFRFAEMMSARMSG